MVSLFSIAFLIISELISVFFPVGLVIFLYKRKKISMKAVLVGVLVFFVSQIVLRLPLLNSIKSQMWFIELSTSKWMSALFFALTAGIFEEIGRFIGFKYLLKGKLEWKNGVAFGAGHGGIESILITGVSLLTPIVNSILINAGKFDSLASGEVPESTLNEVKNALINTPSYMFLFSGFERIFAITAHIAFSLVVLYGVKNKKNIYLLYAILLHTLLDLPTGLFTNTYIIEGYVFIFAVLSFIFIIKSRNMQGFTDKSQPLYR